MENNLIENDSLKEYFPIDYEAQDLRNNPAYLKWKESMIDLKGTDVKFLKCKKDNIYFTCTKKQLKSIQYIKVLVQFVKKIFAIIVQYM